jgi:maltose phosphorylase
MAGTWLAIVQGFGGMRVKNDKLHFNPHIPEKWNAFAFNILFRGNQLNIRVEKDRTIIHNIKGGTLELYLNNQLVEVLAESQREIKN